MMKKREGNLKGLFEFPVEFRDLKMTIVADKELQIEAHSIARRCWRELEQYFARKPELLSPHPVDEVDIHAPEVAQMMEDAAMATDVPPLLTADGAFTDTVAQEIRKYAHQLLLENGPEVYVHTRHPRRIRLFTGGSPLSSRLGVEIRPDLCPAGISTHCCSENLMHPGRSEDAAVAVCSTVSLAAAFAAGAGERMAQGGTLSEIQEWAFRRGEVMGLILIRGDTISKRGSVELIGG